MANALPTYKKSPEKRQAVQNCICGHRPELNRVETAGHHPDWFELKAGAICFFVLIPILAIVDVRWALAPLAILAAVTILACIVKVIRGHRFGCAARDGFLIGIAFFANVLEGLNPFNWF